MKKNAKTAKKNAKADQELEEYCAAYMDFLSKGKTERRCYAEAVRLIEARGFRSLDAVEALKPGDLV